MKGGLYLSPFNPQQTWPNVIVYLMTGDFSFLNVSKGFLG